MTYRRIVNKIAEILEKVFSMPKSLYISLHYFPFFQAIHLPIVVRYNTKIRNMSGKVLLNNNLPFKWGGVKLGFGSVGIFDKSYERSIWEVAGTIQIHGNVKLGPGSRVSVGSNGILILGDNVVNSAKMTIICTNRIAIGANVTTSWDTLVMDTDFHHVLNLDTNTVHPKEKPIEIGDNVWLGARCMVLKGSAIPKNCVIGAMALVNNSFSEPNCLLAGNPAKIKKHNITMYSLKNE